MKMIPDESIAGEEECNLNGKYGDMWLNLAETAHLQIYRGRK